MIRVEADIRYDEGFLAGMVIPSGYAVTAPTCAEARKISAWVERVRAEGDFVRAVGTGHPYRFMSAPRIVELVAPIHERDEDCDVDPETGDCRECGVTHGDPCPDCGGSGFHRPECSVMDGTDGR